MQYKLLEMVLRSGVGFLEAWICTPQAVDSDPRGHPYDPHGEVGIIREEDDSNVRHAL